MAKKTFTPLGKRFKSYRQLDAQKDRIEDGIREDLKAARRAGDAERVQSLVNRRKKVRSRFETYRKNIMDGYLPGGWQDIQRDTDRYTAPRMAPRGWGGYVGSEFGDAQDAHRLARELHRKLYNDSQAAIAAGTST